MKRWALIALDKRGHILPFRGAWITFVQDETGGNAHIVSDVRFLFKWASKSTAAFGIWRPPLFQTNTKASVERFARQNHHQAIVRR